MDGPPRCSCRRATRRVSCRLGKGAVVAAFVVRIAHAYANRRQRIDQALAAGVDLIEADLHYRAGRVWIRHEHRLGLLPLLYNFRLSGVHRQGPWALSLGPLFLRLDLHPIERPDLLGRVSGRAGLLLDLKEAPYPPPAAAAFTDRVVRLLDETGFPGPVGFCGDWPLLDLVRALRPDAAVRYSVDSSRQWAALQSRLSRRDRIDRISISRDLLGPQTSAVLTKAGVDYYCWDVRGRADADRAVELGVSGLIADDLALLRELAGTPVRAPQP